MELKRRNKVSAEFSMASMTDIIFLLLIFFMITSSAISQSAIDVKLPETTLDNPSLKEAITVVISKEGKYYIGDNEIDKNILENQIVNLLKTQNHSSFTIKADENTTHKDVVFVMEIAEKHKFALNIATVKAE